MRYATGGTVLACRLALEHGVAINLGGGYHHAAAGWGGGFCVYADVPLAAKVLHDEGRVGKVLVVDLDAHQGNGTAADLPGLALGRRSSTSTSETSSRPGRSRRTTRCRSDPA